MAKGGKPAVRGTVHAMMQGKGGVGKSTCAALLTQYLQERGRSVLGVDVDPVNHTLAAYKGLPIVSIEIMENDEVNLKRFDEVMERFLTEENDFVLDTGASSFIPLWNYVISNDALSVLRDAGRRVYVHTIIAGGGAMLETLGNFAAIAETLEDGELIVWLNEYESRVEANGKKFSEMQAFQANESKVAATVLVERRNPQTFGADLRRMITDKMTFAEARNGSGYAVMEKQRLSIIWKDLSAQLDRLGIA